jgi:hypothetical protein
MPVLTGAFPTFPKFRFSTTPLNLKEFLKQAFIVAFVRRESTPPDAHQNNYGGENALWGQFLDFAG